jgi:hypothetical protein
VTVREFSPMSIRATPTTTSPSPSWVAAPRRSLPPKRTSPTEATVIGTPCGGRAEDDALEVLAAGDEAVGADDEVLLVVLDVAAAGVGVGLLERGGDVADRQAERLQALGAEHDLVLAVLAAEAVDLDDAGDAAQLRADVPVEQLLELHEVVLSLRRVN